MAASRYRKFLKLIQRWPLDAQKGQSRDLGLRIREDVVATFSEGDQTIMSNPERCDKICASLEELVSNKHAKDFPVKIVCGAVCNDLETAKVFNSEEVRSQKIRIILPIKPSRRK